MTIESRRHPLWIAPMALVAAFLVCAAMAPRASAAYGVRSFDGTFKADEAGAPTTQAGSHPFSAGATILFDLRQIEGFAGPETIPDGQVREIDVELPAGLIGDPSATPKCPAALIGALGICPADTQIGLGGVIPGVDSEDFTYRLYNVAAPATVPALFDFSAADTVPVVVTAGVRPAIAGSDEGYGLDLHIHDIPQALPIYGASLEFFGTPDEGGKPFITMPTSCSGRPLTVRAHTTSWQGETSDAEFVVHDAHGAPIHTEGCSRLPFEPQVSTALAEGDADSPSGLSVEVQTPQSTNSKGLATAHLKSTTVTLPAGLSVNPSAANGLTGCSVGQFDQFGEAPSTCPDSSKVGSVEIHTPLIPDPLTGGVYLAEQGENPFDSLLALYLIAEGDGIRVKLPGKVSADPSSGQLTATFEETPQLPFETLQLDFFGGPGAALATPTTCGTRNVGSSLAPWSGNPPTALTSTVATTSGAGGSGCPPGPAARPFAPGFEAGTVSPAAALHSPFELKVSRPDGAQELGRIEATLPEGVLATLKGVPECSAAAASSGSCGAASQIGSLAVGAGAGASPFYLHTGRAYLTGPYGGAPLGIDFVVPVLAGPLNLGDVNVRAALLVDPETAQVTVRSDPLPTILRGIPLRLRSATVDIDRPGFVVNPTSCDPTSATGRVTSTEGAVANLGDRFQAAGCGALAYQPKVTPRLLGGRGTLRRGGHPRLRVTLTQAAGQANLANVAVTLPKKILLDQSHIRSVCTRVQFAAAGCPASSIYGHAKVYTPLLEKPLEGPVYLRSSSHALPDLVFDLHGQIDIVLAGRIDSHKGGIRVSVAGIPDAPVSRFVLDMKGGKRGLLQPTTDLCRTVARTTVDTTGQNGAFADGRPRLAVPCGKASGPKAGRR